MSSGNSSVSSCLTCCKGIVVFQESLNPSEVIRMIKRERISVLVAVPRILETLKEKIELDFEAEDKLDWFRKEFGNRPGGALCQTLVAVSPCP